MAITLIRTARHGHLSGMEPDESLTSWVARQGGVVNLVPDSDALEQSEFHPERDFGDLDIQDPEIDYALACQLRRAARWPAPFMMPPEERDDVCIKCWHERWSRGLPLYRKRQWAVAWQGECNQHGALHQHASEPSWLEEWPIEELPDAEAKVNDAVVFRGYGSRSVGIPCINLFRDRRGQFLAAALQDVSNGDWWPWGFDLPGLRRVYAKFIHALLCQFGPIRHVYGWRERLARRGAAGVEYWWRSPRISSHHLNVLVEAVIATWTGTELPPEKAGSHERSIVIAQVIGWALGDVSVSLSTTNRDPFFIWEPVIQALPELVRRRMLVEAAHGRVVKIAQRHQAALLSIGRRRKRF